MKLFVTSSSSQGNNYIIYNDTECLLIEAGVKLLEIKKALDFKIDKIRGVLISHEHL